MRSKIDLLKKTASRNHGGCSRDENDFGQAHAAYSTIGRMKILELCLSDGHGGLELYVDRAVRYFHSLHQPCLAVVAPGSLLARRLEAAGIACTELKRPPRLLPHLAARRLARLMEREAVDVLHMHWGKDLDLAVLAKRWCRRPVKLVYTRQMALTRPKKDVYHRRLYSHVDRYLVISQRLFDEAARFLPLPRERLRRLYYGVQAPVARDAAVCTGFLTRAGLASSGFRIGLFGRIEQGKGQHVLIEALAELVRQGEDVAAVLVGHIMDQVYFDGLMASVETSGLAGRVQYYGFHDDPPSVMGCLDAVVLASYAETFGLVLIEAMRAGTVVLGTDAGGVPEIIDDERTGLLFAPGDSSALAAGLRRLVRDPALRERLARAGQADADARFDEARHFQALLAIFAQ